jgi:hypothetical protein
LRAWRIVEPEGEWLLVIEGDGPTVFIDTPVMEKAIKLHTEQGREGVL